MNLDDPINRGFTDLDKFIALYKSFGINLSPEKSSPLPSEDQTITTKITMLADDGDSPLSKFRGYGGFCSIVCFDAAGKFISQGFWEW